MTKKHSKGNIGSLLKMIYIIIILLSVICCMTGCLYKDHPVCEREELTAHSWYDENAGSLDFDDNTARLIVGRNDGSVSISGIFYADDSSITIESNELGTFVVNYRLENDKLLLEWAGKELTLCKTN